MRNIGALVVSGSLVVSLFIIPSSIRFRAAEAQTHGGGSGAALGVVAATVATTTPTDTPTVTPTATPSATLPPGIPECGSLPRGSCRTPGKSFLFLKNKSPDKRDKVLWKWVNGAIEVEEFGDPTKGDASALCIYHGDNLLMLLGVPAEGCDEDTRTGCWKETRLFLAPPAPQKIGYKYKDKYRSSYGVGKVLLRGDKVPGQGKGKILLRAKKENVPDPELVLDEPVVVELINSLTETTGICWGDTYTGAEIIRNDETMFKAKVRN